MGIQEYIEVEKSGKFRFGVKSEVGKRKSWCSMQSLKLEKVEVGVQQDLESWKKWKLGLSTIVEVEKSKSWRSTKTWKL